MPTRMVVAVTACAGAVAADAGPVPATTATALSSSAPTNGVTRLFRILHLRAIAATDGRAGRHSDTFPGARVFT